jgi:peptidoglycan/LPS O-acetylase OafA/YrhL
VTTTESHSAPVAVDVADEHRREVSAGVHFDALDGYRALAALMVVLTHIATTTNSVDGVVGRVLGRFDFGVPLFFLMSGFLLYRPWARAALEGCPAPGLRRYSVRRAARILPLYWVVVVTTLLTLPEIRPVSAFSWVTHLTTTQIYVPADHLVEGLTQTWSLCTEISFYVALPLIGRVALGRRRRSLDEAWRRQLLMIFVLVIIAWVFTLVRVTTGLLPGQSGFWLPGYLDWFAAGMGLALVDVRARLPHPPRLVTATQAAGRDQASSLAIAVAVFAVACTPVAGSYLFTPNTAWEDVSKHLLYLVAALFLLLPGILGKRSGWNAMLSSRWPHRLGLVSYGIFLWHVMLIRLLLPVLGIAVFTGHAFLLGVVVIPTAVAVSTMTYVVIERPSQRWAHRY